MKNKSAITHQEVAQAIKKFHEQGGMIVKLPDQQFQASAVIGAERHQNFESIASLIGV